MLLFGPQAASQTQWPVLHVLSGKATDYLHHSTTLYALGRQGKKENKKALIATQVCSTFFFFNYYYLTVKSAKAVSLQKKVTDIVVFPQALKITR